MTVLNFLFGAIVIVFSIIAAGVFFSTKDTHLRVWIFNSVVWALTAWITSK